MNQSIDAEIEMLNEELENNPTIIRGAEIHEILDDLANKQRLADECEVEAREEAKLEDHMDEVDARDDNDEPEDDNLNPL